MANSYGKSKLLGKDDIFDKNENITEYEKRI
jgi:hypothetical protein